MWGQFGSPLQRCAGWVKERRAFLHSSSARDVMGGREEGKGHAIACLRTLIPGITKLH